MRISNKYKYEKYDFKIAYPVTYDGLIIDENIKRHSNRRLSYRLKHPLKENQNPGFLFEFINFLF